MDLVQEFTFTATLKPPLPIGPGPTCGSAFTNQTRRQR